MHCTKDPSGPSSTKLHRMTIHPVRLLISLCKSLQRYRESSRLKRKAAKLTRQYREHCDLIASIPLDPDARKAAEGYGSVIGPKQHFTSPEVKAYFQIDLERLRSYGLSPEQVRALVAWAIYKIRKVLVASRDGVADLRTECKFETINVRALTVNQETGKKSDFPLPEIGDDLKTAFASLKSETGPLSVRWVPKIEGKAELGEIRENAIKRAGLEAKTKFETKEKKQQGRKVQVRFFVIFGDWSTSDKGSLRGQNSDEPAKPIVEKAIKDFEKNWEAKAQSRKPEKPDADDQDESEDQE